MSDRPKVTDAMVNAAWDVFADAGVSVDASDLDDLMRSALCAALAAQANDEPPRSG